jgi:hypothetical protein
MERRGRVAAWSLGAGVPAASLSWDSDEFIDLPTTL